MVAGLSHELNTPLGNCVSASSFLESKIGEIRADAERGELSREAFAKAVDESSAGFALIRANLERMRIQIETFKRLSGANQETHGAVVPLSDFVDDELPRIAKDEAPETELVVRWDRLDNPRIRYSDLVMIFGQLLDNCREHARAKSATARFRVRDDILEISFTDDGKGVSDEALEKIAEPFFTTARGKNHMGLGLSILSSFVVNKLQGTIVFGHGNPGLRVVIGIPVSNLS